MRNPFATVRQTDVSSPSSSPGSPTYDARMDANISPMEIVGSERLQQARNVHLFDGKGAAADLFSHYRHAQPSPLLGQLAGLAATRDQIERVVSRKDMPPFPGVELGHVPGFHASPRMTPVLGGVEHLHLGAHLGETRSTVGREAAGRRRFGH